MQGGAHGVFAHVDIRTRAHGHVELAVVAIEQQRARPVAFVEPGQGDDLGSRAGDLHGLAVVFEALDRGRFSDIKPVLIEGQTIGPFEALDDFGLGLVVNYVDRAAGFTAAAAVGEQDFVAGSEHHEARNLETRKILFNGEARRQLQPGAFGPADHLRPIVGGVGCKRLGQLFPVHRPIARLWDCRRGDGQHQKTQPCRAYLSFHSTSVSYIPGDIAKRLARNARPSARCAWAILS